MKKLSLIWLIISMLSIVSLKAQSDFGQKLRKKETPQYLDKAKASPSILKNEIKGETSYSLPFTEFFEAATFPPTDWDTFIGTNGVGTSYDWEATGSGYSGNGAWVDYSEVNGALAEDWLVSPLIDLGTNTTLSFYEKQGYPTDYGSMYYIKISTISQSTHADFSTILSYSETDFSNSYTLREIDLSAYDGQSVYIAFVMTNDDGDAWYIDNILIEEETGGGTAGGKLLISEVAYPKTDASARFVELYNSGDVDVDLTDYRLAFYKNTQWVELTGTVAAGDTYIFAPDATDFYNEYGFYADLANDPNYNSSWFNGIDAIILLHKRATGSGYQRYDTYGVAKTDGSGLAWEYTDKHAVRKADIIEDNNPYIEDEWVISTAYPSPYFDVTPGNHNVNYYWTGNTNTRWDEPSNWSVTGGISAVPDAGANILVPAGTSNAPESAYYRFPYFFHSLNIATGATFTLESHDILEIQGDVIIPSGATLNIESDTDGTATFIPKGTVSGNVDVQRYFPDISNTIWHLFSPSINNFVTNTLMDQYLKFWTEPTAAWEYISSTSEVLTPGKGYALNLTNTYGNTIDMKGTLSTSDVDSPILRFTSGAGWEGYNLVGNPYTASVDWDVISATLDPGIDNAIYYWDVENDQYIFYNNGSGTASRHIPAGQAFFIHANTDNQQFTFTTESRTSDSSHIYYKTGKTYSTYMPTPRDDENKLTVETSNSYQKTDKAFLEFHAKGTEEFDGEYDAVKLNSGNEETCDIWFIHNNFEYSINTLPSNMIDGRYEMSIRYGKHENYTLSFDGINSFDEDQPINLYDKISGKYYNLREHKQLNFYNAWDAMENRFEIVFSKGVGIDEPLDNNNWLIYAKDGMLNILPTITKDNSERFSYQVYTIQGKLIEENNDIQKVINKRFYVSNGMYLIKVISDKQQIAKKVMLSK